VLAEVVGLVGGVVREIEEIVDLLGRSQFTC
jgi:hypothetical protein